MDKMNFKQFAFSGDLLKAIEKLGYETPTEVQMKVIPPVMEDQDMIVNAPTGSGKTAAFAIPICEKTELETRYPQCLVLTPTRELAVQVAEDISNIGRFKRIRAAAIYGQQPIYMQKSQLRQRVHIIVATPGRILDHMERNNVNLEKIKYLVIDEADEMLNMGFIEQVEDILETLPKNRISLLFSATMPEEIQKIGDQYMHDPVKIEIVSNNPTTEKIKQVYYKVEQQEKFELLRKIIYTQRPDSCLVFCHTREKVEQLLQSMKDEHYSCSGLHGGMEQRERLVAMQSFKRGNFRFLIATDVAARGIDIDDLSLVINYDLPFEKEKYVHRIGRTGRIGNVGMAVSFVSEYEIKMFHAIEDYVNYKIPAGKDLSIEEVEQGKERFGKMLSTRPKVKMDSSAELNKEIMKLRINAGKKKKMRPSDILGALTKIEGVCAHDVGIIDVQDTCSYIEILDNKGPLVQVALQNMQIKGKNVSVKRV
ncbi:MAG: DEAD/DEAH box helicase [Bacillota bacterium]|nr:DEAD/DEAH box helicase [Bacillota bacterium]